MLPEVEAYFVALKKAEDEYEEARNSAKSYGESRVARNEYAASARKAWDLLKNSNNKLVAWIANNVSRDYEGHASYILKALPVSSISELDEIARNHDWCYVWNEFRSAAIAAGAIEVIYDIQIKVNGGPWNEFWEHQLPNDEYLTKEEISKLFDRGINFIQFDAGRNTIKYQLKPVVQ